MARNDRIVRVEALKQALCASRSGVALKSLAERHDWNLRGLYRDIKALESAGYIIESDNHRFRIVGNPRSSPGVPDADERLALYLARQNAHGWKETSLGKALDRLWHRVSATGDGQAALMPVESTPWIVTRELTGIDLGAHRLRPIQFKRFRQKRSDDGGRRAAGVFRIEFPEPVRGPICLGHSSHFGLGLFVAVPPLTT